MIAGKIRRCVAITLKSIAVKTSQDSISRFVLTEYFTSRAAVAVALEGGKRVCPAASRAGTHIHTHTREQRHLGENRSRATIFPLPLTTPIYSLPYRFCAF